MKKKTIREVSVGISTSEYLPVKATGTFKTRTELERVIPPFESHKQSRKRRNKRPGW